MKRLSPIAEVLASIPEREDPFPHLALLSTDDLLLRRREIQQSLKRLEAERQAIDSELVETFSDAELRFGIRFGGGLQCVVMLCIFLLLEPLCGTLEVVYPSNRPPCRLIGVWGA